MSTLRSSSSRCCSSSSNYQKLQNEYHRSLSSSSSSASSLCSLVAGKCLILTLVATVLFSLHHDNHNIIRIPLHVALPKLFTLAEQTGERKAKTNDNYHKKNDSNTKNKKSSHTNDMSIDDDTASNLHNNNHPIPPPIKHPSSTMSSSSSSSNNNNRNNRNKNNDYKKSQSKKVNSTTTSSSSSSSFDNNNHQHSKTIYKARKEKREKKQKAFLKWCQTTLGIHTLLEIKEFEYKNYIQSWKNELQQDYNYFNFDRSDSNGYNGDNKYDESTTILVRGLAASRDINIDEIILSIPYHALITIQTTIDHDPVLSQILGVKARLKHGWTLSSSQTKIHNNNVDADYDSSPHSDNTSASTSDVNTNSTTNHSKRSKKRIKENNRSIQDYTGSLSIHDSFQERNNNENRDYDDKKDSNYYEIGLLTVALLYHRSLGELSPIWFHIDTLLDDTVSGIDSIPLLWSPKKLQKEFDGVELGPSGDEVRRLVLTMKKDVKIMYDEIMGVLINDHKDIFGRPDPDFVAFNNVNNDLEENDDNEQSAYNNNNKEQEEKGEWMFSYEKFEWAFAIVNSRKWHLPLADLDQDDGSSKNNIEFREENNNKHIAVQEMAGSASANSIPAQQPTDSFMMQQDEAIRLEYSDENIFPRPAPPSSSIGEKQFKPLKHTFMAPLADMLNFGRACTKGRYNPESKMFEVIATCNFVKGQEVTFWYSDDCENVMIANYGFTNPLIPKCLSAEDWQNRSELWRGHALSLEKTLDQVYEELYETLKELEECNCGDNDDKSNDNGQPEDGNKNEFNSKKEIQNNIKDHSAVEEDGHSGIRRTKPRDNNQDEIDL